MKKYFTALIMSCSMFCALPCPFHFWEDELRPLMILMLPFVGALIGALWVALSFAAHALNISWIISSVILAAYPFLVTGYIHLDGFLDVTDAVKSQRNLDERRRILKDPHNGSFAVIACVLLVITQFAFFAGARLSADIRALFFIPIVSRIMSSLCVTLLRPMNTSEYSGTYRNGVKRSHAAFLFALLVIVLVCSFIFTGKYICVPVAVLAGYIYSLRKAFRSLDGMSGDVSGYALTIGELCGIAAYALI